jgi:hypothetical protein
MSPVLIKHPKSFSEGIRVIFKVSRRKDTARTNNQNKHVYISHNTDEYNSITSDLIISLEPGERIYSSVCRVDLQKAIKKFNLLKVQRDYGGYTDKEEFYLNISKYWKRCLGKSQRRDLFLFDIDDIQTVESVRKELGDRILHGYETKNGHHFITRAFNPKEVGTELASHIMVKGSLLVAYN